MTQHYFSQDPNFPTKTVVSALFIAAFLGYLNETLLNVALTTLMHEFAVSKQSIQWMTTGFFLVMGAFTPLTASILLWFKTKTMALLTLGIFLLGSLICAFAVNFPMLLGGRLIQALSAACAVPLLINAILAIFPPEKRGRAMSLVMVIFTVAPAIGPTLSGIIVDTLGWRYLFLATVPFVLLAMLMIAFTLKHNLMEQTRPKIDVISVLQSFIGFGSLVYTTSQFTQLALWQFVGLLVLAVSFIAFFAKRQFSLGTPLLDLRVFKVAQFRYSMIIVFFAYALFMGLEFLLPMYMQQVLLFSATVTGFVLMPASIAEAVFAPIFGTILDKKGGRPVLLISGVVMSLAMSLLWLLITENTAEAVLACIFALFAVSVSAAATGETHGLNHLSKAQNPHGTAIAGMIMPISGALGVAFFIGVVQIGEQISTKPTALLTMLDGVQLSIGISVIFAFIVLFLATKIRTLYDLNGEKNGH
ncbi:MFS transporter [Caviibacterium pharyngocola]|uniref:MFS transporter n=1 Tax=Caviibacterium pharyngocola TaxID=28159 RepID=A0A2M8RTR2_9PAST|nr:MFS transporter [Caviibacterium pharyngocola]PJG82277.1 MFS transporter [Caviibacterium pharyngocola]